MVVILVWVKMLCREEGVTANPTAATANLLHCSVTRWKSRQITEFYKENDWAFCTTHRSQKLLKESGRILEHSVEVKKTRKVEDYIKMRQIQTMYQAKHIRY